ncbi:DNA cytosine methyltransferase [Brevundimonas sp.]|uniref:DNA cytosine methyltransferase n=1 Tax=Brevundimonas sp. TaxID=1871086 RepID=UPI002D3B3026|nr:DNA cytosine methyltransferase [Brevundimonas sp.]HYD27287.1 DNA cytosine methyltransferase [Brevundimonas sp.]
MRVVDLFCGTGGFSRGAHAAGFNVVAAYDLDDTLTSSYGINFPSTTLRHRDISGLTASDIEQDAGTEVDGIFGGPPCQGFSSIGLRDTKDPRRLLLGHFFRLVREARPKFFVMENVVGLAHSESIPLLNAALESVSEAYDVSAPWILNAADFGAATIRRRLFVVGVRRDIGTAPSIQSLTPYHKPAATVRDAISDLLSAKRIADREANPGFDVWKIQSRKRLSPYAAKLRAPDHTFTGHRLTVHSPAVAARFAKVMQGEMDKIGRHPRLALAGQCPTLRAGTGSDRGSFQSVRPIHPLLDRVITVREAARLQGFPDAHVFHTTVWHSFRMIGNSVSPIVSEALFSMIRDHLQALAARRTLGQK